MKILDLLTIPEDAPSRLREVLKLKRGERIRLSYLSGTGDVVGTYSHWRNGRSDPRVPVITYSAMFFDLVKRLDARAQVITPWPAPVESEEMIQFSTVARKQTGSRLRHFFNEVTYTQKCVDSVNKFDPHVVVASTDFQPLGWKRLQRHRKLVVSAHNTFWPMGRKSRDLKSLLKLRILANQSQAIDGAVCTSAECMRQIAEVTKGRVVGLVEFPQVVALYEAESRNLARNLLFLGRIEASKGIFMLLDAFLGLGEASKKLNLVFAGSGTAEMELKLRIAASASENIQFLGSLDSEGVHKEIAASDLIICPTTSAFNEGLALVGFEGAAHGIPSLLSSVVPAAELLGDGCTVFEADNAEALKKALAILTTDEAVYSGLRQGSMDLRPGLYDRSRSWGSQLCTVLLSL